MKKLTTNNIENIKVNDIIAFQNNITNDKGVIVQVNFEDEESCKAYNASGSGNLFTNGNGYARINGNKTSICRELLRLGGFSIFIFDSLSELYAFLDSTKTPIENLEIGSSDFKKSREVAEEVERKPVSKSTSNKTNIERLVGRSVTLGECMTKADRRAIKVVELQEELEDAKKIIEQ